jgi:hypothetical protein
MVKSGPNNKITLKYVAYASTISVAINLLLIFINDTLFLEKLQIEAMNEYLAGTGLSKFIQSGAKPIELEISWPWYSLVFYYGLYCIYWFYLGKISTAFTKGNKNDLLIIPLITCLIFMDMLFPLYLAFVYFGYKLSSREGFAFKREK